LACASINVTFAPELPNLSMMELNANVKYGSGHARFRIRKENPGVYCADLLNFDGDNRLSPPQKISLVRGFRQWAGSSEDVNLLNELGKIIEESQSTASDISAFK
jgi:hypothetical protein